MITLGRSDAMLALECIEERLQTYIREELSGLIHEADWAKEVQPYVDELQDLKDFISIQLNDVAESEGVVDSEQPKPPVVLLGLEEATWLDDDEYVLWCWI